jgi:hypothetical protein
MKKIDVLMSIDGELSESDGLLLECMSELCEHYERDNHSTKEIRMIEEPTQYEKHKEESDKIVKDLLLASINNTLYHDALSEAQTMIGERDLTIRAFRLTIARQELVIQNLHNDALMARITDRG